jgi:HSP20 family protein
MTVETGSVKAAYDAGVLSITLQKKEAAKPRQVKIEIGASDSERGRKQVEAPNAA